jgi:hypothetical protein
MLLLYIGVNVALFKPCRFVHLVRHVDLLLRLALARLGDSETINITLKEY